MAISKRLYRKSTEQTFSLVKLLWLVIPAVVLLNGCSVMNPITQRIMQPSNDRYISIDHIARLSDHDLSRVGLQDGRARTVEQMRLLSDSVSYVIIPGKRAETVHSGQIHSIEYVRTNHSRGVLRGATIGAVLGAVAGPLLEFWAGNRGGPLALSAPLYAGAWGILGGGIGAIAGDRQHYQYLAPPEPPAPFVPPANLTASNE